MTPLRISEQLLSQLDVLISSLQDDPVLATGLRRERERLVCHLQFTVEPWLRAQGLSRRPAIVSSQVCSLRNNQRTHRRRRIQNTIQRRGRHRLCASLQEACYLALAAEIIDGRVFDRLSLLSQRTLRTARSQDRNDQASSSSPSAWPTSLGTPSGESGSGTLIGGTGRGDVSAGRPSRTYRSSVSTMRAWA